MFPFSLTLGLLVVLAARPADSAEFRQWTDDTGGFSVKAKLIKVEGGKVFLRKENGAVLEVPLNRLSKDSLAFAKKEAERIQQESAIKESRTNKKALQDGISKVWEKANAMAMPAQQAIIRQEGFDALAKNMNGKKLIVRFPIESVGETNSGGYYLLLGRPDFDDKFSETVGQSYQMELYREELMSITKSSVLVVTGEIELRRRKTRLVAPRIGERERGIPVMYPRSSYAGVGMRLLKPKVRIETPKDAIRPGRPVRPGRR